MICFVNQLITPNLKNEQNFKKSLKKDLKSSVLKFQLGVSMFQFQVSFLTFEVSDRSLEVRRTCVNCFDCNSNSRDRN